MYYLMNKDNIAGIFEKNNDDAFEQQFKAIDMPKRKMPYGFKDINHWLESRKASKHNAHLKRIMTQLGCEKTDGFIEMTHAASINDTFWVKSDNESCNWNDISLYRNQFSKVVSRLAFEGVGIPNETFSPTSPELTSEGSYRKCFIKKPDGIFIYKRGYIDDSEGIEKIYHNAGKEPYCEAMASELAEKLCPHAVHYDVVKLHGTLASRCRLFTDEMYGYAPYYTVSKGSNSISDALKYFASIGAEEDFRRMMVLDALTLNIDRHQGNFGILFNNDTLEPVSMAPVFDMNRSLIPYYEPERGKVLGDYIMDYALPQIGDDFTRTAQLIITDSIKRDLNALKDFEFTFRGNDFFSDKRVRLMEEIVQKQAAAILSDEKLFTKDVFIPEYHIIQKEKHEEQKKNVDAIRLSAEQFADLVDQSERYMSSLEVSDESIRIVVESALPPDADEIIYYFDFVHKDILVEVNGQHAEVAQVLQSHPVEKENISKYIIEFEKIIGKAMPYYNPVVQAMLKRKNGETEKASLLPESADKDMASAKHEADNNTLNGSDNPVKIAR